MKHLQLIILAAACLGSVLAVTHAQETDSEAQQSLKLIENAPTDCILGDGYVCDPVSEMSLTLEQKRLVPAHYLEIWPIVYVDFKAMDELSEAQKEFKHYRIGFAEDAQHYIVMFRALLLPGAGDATESTGLVNATFGKSMRYLVDKKTLQIVSRQYYR